MDFLPWCGIQRVLLVQHTLRGGIFAQKLVLKMENNGSCAFYLKLCFFNQVWLALVCGMQPWCYWCSVPSRVILRPTTNEKQ